MSTSAIRDVLFLCASTSERFLPHLQSLTCVLTGSKAFRTLPHLTSPTVTSLNLIFKSLTLKPLIHIEGIFQTIALMPRLQTLSIGGALYINTPESVLSLFCSSLKKLNDLGKITLQAGELLYPNQWDALGSLPNLYQIEVLYRGIIRTDKQRLPAADLRFGAGKFLSLKWLTIEGPIATLLSLFESGKPPHLCDLQLFVTTQSAQLDVQPLFRALAKNNQIECFTCAFESDSYRFLSSLIKYTRMWRDLSYLRIQTEQPAGLTDEEFGNFSSAMPNLELISISVDPTNFQELPVATFRAIYNLARGYPALLELGIFINTDPQFIPVYANGDATFRRMQHIDFGLSTVVEVLPSIIFLGRVCGASSPIIASGLTADPQRSNVSADMNSRVEQVATQWTQVAEGLKDLQAYTQPLHARVAKLEAEDIRKEDENGEEVGSNYKDKVKGEEDEKSDLAVSI